MARYESIDKLPAHLREQAMAQMGDETGGGSLQVKGPYIPTEHEEQVALFAWADTQMDRCPELSLMFAIPNGGHRFVAVAAKLKAEGVKAGVPDVFLPVPRGGKHGLWLELKRSKGGRLGEAQKAWADALEGQGYAVGLSYGAVEAIQLIEEYMEGADVV